VHTICEKYTVNHESNKAMSEKLSAGNENKVQESELNSAVFAKNTRPISYVNDNNKRKKNVR
jgi:hypothetical protein